MKNFLLVLAASTLLLVLFVYLATSDFGLKRVAKSGGDAVACEKCDFEGKIEFSAKRGTFEGQEVNVPEVALLPKPKDVLGLSNDEKWIEVDLSEQKLLAWEGERLFIESKVSTGLSWWPTPQGEFRIWTKLRATRMEGGSGRYYYNLPNVPYVMFFENEKVPGWRGYGLHGTYWHDDFGTPRSHGCVNLPTSIAEQLYYWTTPVLPEGKWTVRTTSDNPGTRIVIHE